MFMVAQYFIRRPGIEDGQSGALLTDSVEFVGQGSPLAATLHTLQPIAYRLGHRLGFGLSGEAG
jgi:hypothetical protein